MKMKHKHLIEGPLSPLLISELLTLGDDDKGAGALSVFIGRVREDDHDGRRVSAIEYSAYPDMAEMEAQSIISTVRSAFSDVRDIVVVHSTGIVKTGEVSLFVMVRAGHRDQATRACRHTLEMIKEKLPVWKKELYDDSTAKWK